MHGNRLHDLNRIFSFIVQYKADHDGNSPSILDIGRECRISSKSVVAYNLLVLEKAGKICLVRGKKSRSIEVIGGRWTFVGVCQ